MCRNVLYRKHVHIKIMIRRVTAGYGPECHEKARQILFVDFAMKGWP